MNALIAKALEMTTEELKKQAAAMAVSAEDWAGDVLMAILGALETRIPEAEFISFCDGL